MSKPPCSLLNRQLSHSPPRSPAPHTYKIYALDENSHLAHVTIAGGSLTVAEAIEAASLKMRAIHGMAHFGDPSSCCLFLARRSGAKHEDFPGLDGQQGMEQFGHTRFFLESRLPLQKYQTNSTLSSERALLRPIEVDFRDRKDAKGEERQERQEKEEERGFFGCFCSR